MGIFSSIKDAIWGSDDDKAKDPAPEVKSAPATQEREAISQVDVVQRVSAIPGAESLNWRTSIVDLLKLLNLDSSYENRKELAAEVGIEGYSGSAEDNIRLHRAVMKKLADAGGIVPPDLKD